MGSKHYRNVTDRKGGGRPFTAQLLEEHAGEKPKARRTLCVNHHVCVLPLVVRMVEGCVVTAESNIIDHQSRRIEDIQTGRHEQRKNKYIGSNDGTRNKPLKAVQTSPMGAGKVNVTGHVQHPKGGRCGKSIREESEAQETKALPHSYLYRKIVREDETTS